MGDKLLYIDAAAGAGGDMLAGAMAVLAGWDDQRLQELVARLGLEGVEARLVRRAQGALTGVALEVSTTRVQPPRHLKDVLGLLRGLGPEAAQKASGVFQRLAEAEARVHGTTVDEVHFHETGAVDAIVEVGVFSAAMAEVGVEEVVCSPLPLGRGWVSCAHGELPLPAPAVVELLRDAPVEGWPAAEETLTPTAAAIISALASSYGPLPLMRLGAVATALGSRPSLTGRPNLLRLMLGSRPGELEEEQLVEISFVVDDMDPEELAMALEQLRAAGAADVLSWPVAMKKGRTGAMVLVLAASAEAGRLAELALEKTTTLGVRLGTLRRVKLPRTVHRLSSPWGEVRVKLARGPGGVKLKPEADDVARLARSSGQPEWKLKRLLTALAYTHLAGEEEDGGR